MSITGVAIVKRRVCQRMSVAVVLALACAWFASATAADNKQWSLPGLAQPAEILVDNWGVPHIYAADLYDAFRVQGFNAARDRLWQIDLWRRRGLGELAAVFGPDYVEQDAAARLFLYRGSMHDEWLAYGADAKRVAEAFVAGINAYVDLAARDPKLLPAEFVALGYTPAHWQAEDVVRIRSHGLWRNVTSEVTRAEVACRYGLAADMVRKVLEPAWTTKVPEGLDPCLVTEAVLRSYKLATAEVKFVLGRVVAEIVSDAMRDAAGSNNWVVAPSRTATGRPLLANDPHRAHAVPSLRYAAQLVAPGLNVIGAGEPALPGISIGHNERIAFGLTIFNLDQEDLYVYDVLPNAPNQYVYGAGQETMTTVTEHIAVKGAQERIVALRFTRHGPVIYTDTKNHAFALRAAWLLPGMAPYFGSIDYMRANNWNEFLGALNHWGAPGENQVYADTSGNIGYKPAGYFPHRVNFDGLLPVPGDGRYEWRDAFDADALPVSFNPASGWIATANAMNLPADYPINERRVGFEWTPPWRYQRIAQVLSGNKHVSVADAVALQRDYGSIPAQRLLPLLTHLHGRNEHERAALTLFAHWDAFINRDSAAAALFNVWWQIHLLPEFARRHLPAGATAVIPTPDSLYLIDQLTAKQDAASQSAVLRDALLLDTLGAAYENAQSLLGSDATKWRWGTLHHIAFEHPLLDQLTKNAALPIYERGGNGETPNNTTYTGNDFLVRSGASWRMVLDVGNWDAARMTNAPGQSGDARSPFYNSLLKGWADDDSFPLLYSRAAVEANTLLRIQLVPALAPVAPRREHY